MAVSGGKHNFKIYLAELIQKLKPIKAGHLDINK